MEQLGIGTDVIVKSTKYLGDNKLEFEEYGFIIGKEGDKYIISFKDDKRKLERTEFELCQ